MNCARFCSAATSSRSSDTARSPLPGSAMAAPPEPEVLLGAPEVRHRDALQLPGAVVSLGRGGEEAAAT